MERILTSFFRSLGSLQQGEVRACIAGRPRRASRPQKVRLGVASAHWNRPLRQWHKIDRNPSRCAQDGSGEWETSWPLSQLTVKPIAELQRLTSLQLPATAPAGWFRYET